MLERAMISFALTGAEWVLWLLVILSVLSLAVMLERGLFYLKRRVDLRALTAELAPLLDGADVETLTKVLERRDTMESKVVLAGLASIHRGPRAVTDMMDAELVRQKERFDAYLVFLGTLGNNAPFIGLFGTVLGIIRAFKDLAMNDPTGGTANARIVMSGISEALVATAVGLLVALPAVMAFNYFKTIVRRTVANTETLRKTVNARLDDLCSS